MHASIYWNTMRKFRAGITVKPFLGHVLSQLYTFFIHFQVPELYRRGVKDVLMMELDSTYLEVLVWLGAFHWFFKPPLSQQQLCPHGVTARTNPWQNSNCLVWQRGVGYRDYTHFPKENRHHILIMKENGCQEDGNESEKKEELHKSGVIEKRHEKRDISHTI